MKIALVILLLFLLFWLSNFIVGMARGFQRARFHTSLPEDIRLVAIRVHNAAVEVEMKRGTHSWFFELNKEEKDALRETVLDIIADRKMLFDEKPE